MPDRGAQRSKNLFGSFEWHAADQHQLFVHRSSSRDPIRTTLRRGQWRGIECYVPKLKPQDDRQAAATGAAPRVILESSKRRRAYTGAAIGESKRKCR